MEQKIRRFTDLIAWQKSHKLVLEIYRFTNSFPSHEQFCLTSQLRRCGVSASSNIAEGFSRRTIKDKSHFYTMALGSVTEMQNQIFIARDIGYITREDADNIFKQTEEVYLLLRGLDRGLSR